MEYIVIIIIIPPHPLHLDCWCDFEICFDSKIKWLNDLKSWLFAIKVLGYCCFLLNVQIECLSVREYRFADLIFKRI